MSLFYQIAYRLGFAPWEAAATHPPAAAQVAACLGRELRERGTPGRALDIGCGRGHWSIRLAEMRWQVTGVDIVESALRKARQNAAAAGVSIWFCHADLTRLDTALALGKFDFFWDFGALHGLSPGDLVAAANGIDSLAAPHATMVMLVWAPGRRGPLPRGLSTAEIGAAFPRWILKYEEPFDVSGLPPPLRNVGPRFCRLQLT